MELEITTERNNSIWTKRELKALRPPEKLKPSEWADKYRVLDSRSSAQPGKWRTSRTPYLKKIMDIVVARDVQEIVFAKPTQVGGTEAIINLMGYFVDQDPCPMMIVYPTKELAESISKNRLQTALRTSHVLKSKWKNKESQTLELQFDDMYVALSGANSPSSLASRPVRVVLLDEVDKFPAWTGSEASPIKLARERTKTFYNKKMFITSTPTTSHNHIWKNLLLCDVIYQYYVPCPHCGEYHSLKFSQIKWSDEANGLRDREKAAMIARETAYYECESCGAIIENRDKAKMLYRGEWRSVKYTDQGEWKEVKKPEKVVKVGFQLNTIYSPWVEFGEIAAEFLKTKDDPAEFMNFINSWLGEPWKDKSTYMESNIIKQRMAEHERGFIPDRALLLTMAVDVQDDHFWWLIRAWGENINSWLVDHGRAETWVEIEERVNYRYKKSSGEENLVNLCLVDSGYRTNEVYEFCAKNSDVCIPCKGSSGNLTAPYKISTIEKGNLKLIMVNTFYYKSSIYNRLKKEPEKPGSFLVYHEEPYSHLHSYAEQLTSEHKVIIRAKNGSEKEVFQKVSSHADNHYLDCEVYNFTAAEIMNVRYLKEPEKKINKIEKREAEKEEYKIPEVDWF